MAVTCAGHPQPAPTTTRRRNLTNSAERMMACSFWIALGKRALSCYAALDGGWAGVLCAVHRPDQ